MPLKKQNTAEAAYLLGLDKAEFEDLIAEAEAEEAAEEELSDDPRPKTPSRRRRSSAATVEKKLRGQFKKSALVAHPDKGGTHNQFLDVQGAYEKLTQKAREVLIDRAAPAAAAANSSQQQQHPSAASSTSSSRSSSSSQRAGAAAKETDESEKTVSRKPVKKQISGGPKFSTKANSNSISQSGSPPSSEKKHATSTDALPKPHDAGPKKASVSQRLASVASGVPEKAANASKDLSKTQWKQRMPSRQVAAHQDLISAWLLVKRR